MIGGGAGRYWVEGPINLRTAAEVLAEGHRCFAEEVVVVDLGRVTETDSAAVSVLLEWTRQARARKRSISFTNPPRSLETLATLYGVHDFIPNSPQ